MEVKLKFGFDRLLFGMQQNHVESLYGKPDFLYKDEEANIIAGYNKLKSRLTFYADEDFKLGYITTSQSDLLFWNTKLIGEPKTKVLSFFKEHKVDTWENEKSEGVLMCFNEDNWLFLHFDYDVLVKIEIGAVFNKNNEFDWKFKG